MRLRSRYPRVSWDLRGSREPKAVDRPGRAIGGGLRRSSTDVTGGCGTHQGSSPGGHIRDLCWVSRMSARTGYTCPVAQQASRGPRSGAAERTRRAPPRPVSEAESQLMMVVQDPTRLTHGCSHSHRPELAKSEAGPRRPSREAGLRQLCATRSSARYVEHDYESTRGAQC